LKSKRSFNRAIAFRDPFGPALEIINDFVADVFFDPDSWVQPQRKIGKYAFLL